MPKYKYPRPAVAIDCVVFGLTNTELQLLLIRRSETPYKHRWALPGGFVRIDESLDEAAQRKLKEETGVDCGFLEQLYTFGAVNRDPRERVITVAYYALLNSDNKALLARTDAVAAKWYPIHNLPKLAFDHEHIIDVAYQRLQAKVCYQPIGFELLPKKFTLSQLQNLYEIILQRDLDKRNFRKKVLKLDILVPLEERQANVAHRAARLYTFDTRRYTRMQKQGFHFENLTPTISEPILSEAKP